MEIKVVIATAGRDTLLERTLASLAECELPAGYRGTIVVENGPAGDARRAVEACPPSLRCSYLYVDRPNKSNALNVALEALHADCLVVFADDDIRFDTRQLVAYERAADTHKEAYFGGPLGVDYAGDPPPAWLEALLPSSAKGLTEENSKPGRFLGCNWASYAGDCKEAGGFDLRFGPGGTAGSTGQESEMQSRLEALGRSARWVEDARVWHFVPPERCSPEWLLERVHRIGILRGYRDGDRYVRLAGIPVLPVVCRLRREFEYRVTRIYGSPGVRFSAAYKSRKAAGVLVGLERAWRERRLRVSRQRKSDSERHRLRDTLRGFGPQGESRDETNEEAID